MKRSELVVSVALVPLDFLALLAAAWSAIGIRQLPFVKDLRPVLFQLPTSTYMRAAALVAVAWIVCFAVSGLYHHRVTDTLARQFFKVLVACSAGLVLITMLVFLRGELFSSRFVILAGWALAIVYVTLLRAVVLKLERMAFRRGYAAHRIAIVGRGREADSLKKAIDDQPELGYRVTAVVAPNMANLEAVRQHIRRDLIDEVLFVDAGADNSVRQQFLELAEEEHVVFRYAPDVLNAPLGIPVVDFALGLPIIEVPETTLEGWGRVTKRAIDIVGASFGALVLSPVILLTALAVWFDSGSPVVYKSERLGRGRRFLLLKFRSMRLEYCTGQAYGGEKAERLYEQLIAERNARRGPVPKIADDPRFTPVGKWIRRYSLDELPQLWNVIRGEMSLVGPRPHLPKEVANYERHHKKVLAIKPGVTGLSQVSGRSDLDFEDEVRLDRYYIEHWSPWLDFRILMKTLIVVFEARRTL